MPKRVAEEQEEGEIKRVTDLDAKISGSYEGYVPEEEVTSIEVIEEPINDLEKQKFYDRYVLGRRPCKIKMRDDKFFDWNRLRSGNLLNSLSGDQIVQVENKVDGGFGSGTKRLKMPFKEFLQRLSNGARDIYLTTQYEEDNSGDDSESDDDFEETNHKMGDVTNDEQAAIRSKVSTRPVADSGEETEHSETFITALDHVPSDNESDFIDSHDDFDELAEDSPVTTLSTGPLYEREIIQRIHELYQPPLTTIAGKLPTGVPFLSPLLTQQINMWIGSTAKDTDDSFFTENFNPKDEKLGFGRRVPGGGSSSGLHHDHADNIYIPIEGRKRFTVFSPADAMKMYTVGEIEKVFLTGVINYKRNERAPLWRALRDDGAIITEVAAHRLEVEADSLSEEEAEQLRALIASENNTEDLPKPSDPPHFSKIPSAVLHMDEIKDQELKDKIHQQVQNRWPLLKKANRIYIDVQPGEMLWLPCGWFHEVTSFGNSDNNSHVAVNYWFIPPNGKSMEYPYTASDRYWTLDYERTKIALSHYCKDAHQM
ncbi:HDL200Wp [Eremothecium sinecaudum]|uniref:HDL200Wp n=1 Tax=Eremothecium sinecaudum TaxID=45286 RepID=A0A0X8HSC5_9SACH|nr:HDL200Wp [Eremothecium sinecaudum]AMD20544.1 HDL200Wp [Eremothecium sinecaudum]